MTVEKKMKRTFFAIVLPEPFLCFYENEVYPLVCGQEGIKPVKPYQGHITLKFLGNTEEDRISYIAADVSKKMNEEEAFTIEYTGFGAFPGMQKARVLWLGFDDSSGHMAHLAHALDKSLFFFGFERERRKFQPHMTIGRIKKIIRPESLNRMNSTIKSKIYIEKIKIDMITFFESELTPAGPVYSVIAQIPIGKIEN